MKSMIVLIALLAGTSSFACDALIGTWQCQSHDSSGSYVSKDNYTKMAGGGIAVSTIDENGQVETMLYDGKSHADSLNNNAVTMTYTGTFSCKDASNATVDVSMEVKSADSSLKASLQASIVVTGNQLSINTTGTGVATGPQGSSPQDMSAQETCTKIQ